MSSSPHELDPNLTTWHITFGTYGTRLHGGDLPTVDRQHNHRGEPFLGKDAPREYVERQRMRARCVHLTTEQRFFVEDRIPEICNRGRWSLRICAAQDDHIHTLLDILPATHGQVARRLLKRWLGQALDEAFGKRSGGTWWAEEGSNIPVTSQSHLDNAYPYIERQRVQR